MSRCPAMASATLRSAAVASTIFRPRSRLEHDLPAALTARAQGANQVRTIRQGGRVELDLLADPLLETAAAGKQPERRYQHQPGPLPEQQEHAFPQRIRGDQRSVQIDAERPNHR